MKKTIYYSSLLLLVAEIPAFAQWSNFTGFVGGGFTKPVNPIATRLDTGWNVAAGTGYNFSNRAGLMLDFMFNQMPVNRTYLSQVQAPDGNLRTWGFMLDPVFHLTREAPVDIYVTGGGGIYHRAVDYTQPVVSSGSFFDPGQYKGGIDGGVGFAVKLGSSHVKLFGEARYHHIFTRPLPTDIIPVTFGFRW